MSESYFVQDYLRQDFSFRHLPPLPSPLSTPKEAVTPDLFFFSFRIYFSPVLPELVLPYSFASSRPSYPFGKYCLEKKRKETKKRDRGPLVLSSSAAKTLSRFIPVLSFAPPPVTSRTPTHSSCVSQPQPRANSKPNPAVSSSSSRLFYSVIPGSLLGTPYPFFAFTPRFAGPLPPNQKACLIFLRSQVVFFSFLASCLSYPHDTHSLFICLFALPPLVGLYSWREEEEEEEEEKKKKRGRRLSKDTSAYRHPSLLGLLPPSLFFCLAEKVRLPTGKSFAKKTARPGFPSRLSPVAPGW